MAHHRKILYLATFLFSIPVAITTYINSSFLEGFVSTQKIGLIYIASSLVTIWGLLFMPKLLTRFGNRRISLYLSVLTLISLLILAFSESTTIIVLAFILNFVSINFLVMSLDIFVEEFSQNTSVGKFRGLYLMIVNSAWVIAQMLSGSIITKSSYEGIYLFAAGFMMLCTAVFALFLHDFRDPEYRRITMWRTFRYFRERKNLLNIYILNLILRFFFAWMIIYTPIYLHEYLGLDWDKISLIFAIMLLPFIILEYPLGKLSDKVGEKKMLALGFLIAGTATAVFPLVHTPTVWLLALTLFFTRVGAATIEIMSETYFFKSVPDENVGALGFFRNTGPVSFIIAPLMATPLIIFLPSLEYLFYILATLLFFGFLLARKLRDIK